jgi:acetyl-CoA carboxylase carboxyltransferase component
MSDGSPTKEMREDLRQVLEARERLQDAARPEDIKKQHDRGKMTARERLDLLLDPDGRSPRRVRDASHYLLCQAWSSRRST